MVASISSSTVSDWSNALYAKLDTKNQGFIDQSGLELAFAKATGAAPVSPTDTGNNTSASGSNAEADQLFAQLDSNRDGKVTKSELSSAIGKLADELNAQVDQSRVAKAGGDQHVARPHRPEPGTVVAPPPAGASGGASASASATASYIAAADTNGDGTVSATEAAAYQKLLASGEVSTPSATSNGHTPATSNGVGRAVTKDDLVSRLQALGSSESRHASTLTKLIDNFAAADANGDGKLTRAEGQAYLKANRTTDTQTPDAQTGDAVQNGGDARQLRLDRALEVLKAYVQDNQAKPAGETQPIKVTV